MSATYFLPFVIDSYDEPVAGRDVFAAVAAFDQNVQRTMTAVTPRLGALAAVSPPATSPDGYVAPPDQTGTGRPFAFDRLGVRVPAVIVSPYIPRGTVDHTVYEHASIPATVSKLFLKGQQSISPRERSAHTFDRVLTLATPRADDDTVVFDLKSASTNR